MGRKLAIFLAVLALGLCACGKPPAAPAEPTETVLESVAAQPPETAPEPETVPTEPEETAPREERFYLTFAGDCTLGTHAQNYYATVCFIQTVGEDYGYPFRNVAEYFQNDDLTVVNLEGPLCDGGMAAQKQHAFRGPAAYVDILTQGSVEAVSLANNHAKDYGRSGYDSTRSLLEEAGIAYAEHQGTALVTTQSGLTVGLYGSAYALDGEKTAQAIADLKEAGAEITVVLAHWGTEYSYSPRQQQLDEGHAAIDAGADLVVGTHPHVLQPMERYGNGLIFYSLGNFSFGGNSNPRDYDTVLVRQEVIRDAEGTVRLGETELIPACVSSEPGRNNYQPTPYAPEEEGYSRVLEKLAGTWEASQGK